MKILENIQVRHRAYEAIRHVVAAQEALETAREELILAEHEAALSENADEVRFEIERMLGNLFANMLTQGGLPGGDAKAWDLRSVALRLGEAACAVPCDDEVPE